MLRPFYITDFLLLSVHIMTTALFNDLFLFLLTLFLEETLSIAAGIGVGDGEEERVGRYAFAVRFRSDALD
jgi:hypothetical protein